jgi:hypothetical protein
MNWLLACFLELLLLAFFLLILSSSSFLSAFLSFLIASCFLDPLPSFLPIILFPFIPLSFSALLAVPCSVGFQFSFQIFFYQERDSIMYNHTECTANCIAKQEDCNPKTETFSNCICNCNYDASYCNSTWQTFNTHKCDCECKFVQQCLLYMEWNPVTCQCECAKCIRDMCTKANLVLDTQQCKCIWFSRHLFKRFYFLGFFHV